MDKINLLIIEDDDIIQSLYLRVFQDDKFDVKQAFNGKEAFEILENFDPKLILLDLIMPVMDGEYFLQIYYEKNNYSIPVPILISSVNTEKAELLVKQYRNVYFIKKTLKKSLLLDSVNEFLE